MITNDDLYPMAKYIIKIKLPSMYVEPPKLEDLLQELVICGYKALQKLDSDRSDGEVKDYIFTAMSNRYKQFIGYNLSSKRYLPNDKLCSLDYQMEDGDSMEAVFVDVRPQHDVLSDIAVDMLKRTIPDPLHEWAIFDMRCNGDSWGDIGKKFGIGRETARQRLKHFIMKNRYAIKRGLL